MRKLWPGLLACLGATLFGALSWSRLPERVASHWNAQGVVDGYGSRTALVVLLPLFALALAGVLVIAPRIDPKRRNFPLHAGPYWLVANAILTFVAVIYLFVIGANLGWGIPLRAVLAPALGLLFVIIGLVMTRIRPNWIFGIRTPWTMSSERSWAETHRLGGFGFVLVGVLIMVAAVVAPSLMFTVFFAGLTVNVLVAVVWSYIAWKRDPNALGRDGA